MGVKWHIGIEIPVFFSLWCPVKSAPETVQGCEPRRKVTKLLFSCHHLNNSRGQERASRTAMNAFINAEDIEKYSV